MDSATTGAGAPFAQNDREEIFNMQPVNLYCPVAWRWVTKCVIPRAAKRVIPREVAESTDEFGVCRTAGPMDSATTGAGAPFAQNDRDEIFNKQPVNLYCPVGWR
jgi:hypothetical protein